MGIDQAAFEYSNWEWEVSGMRAPPASMRQGVRGMGGREGRRGQGEGGDKGRGSLAYLIGGRGGVGGNRAIGTGVTLHPGWEEAACVRYIHAPIRR